MAKQAKSTQNVGVVGIGPGGLVTYYEIADFKLGIDTRKSIMTAPPNTLRTLENAHITPGGEIEKRSKFEMWYDLNSFSGPVFGLVSLNNNPYVVTTGGSGIGTSPGPSNPGFFYVTPPSGIALQEIYDWDVFDSKLFITFQGYTGASYGSYSYYDGYHAPQADGRCYGCRTYKSKMYGVNGNYLFFSAVGHPEIWQDPDPVDGVVEHNGSGFMNLATNDGSSEYMGSMEVYYDKMAIFSALSCQLLFLDADPNLNQYYQTLRDAGTIARNSVRQYVANDVYFLGAHGIRSLRARDLTTTAAVADVGSPIDLVIQDLIAARGTGGATDPDMGAMQTVLSPRTGRIWMSAYDRIFVLSNYASPNISAWSTYTPGFNVTRHGLVYADHYIFLLGTDRKIYRYGSYGAPVYDSCPVTVTTPFLSFDKPATYKFYQGFDAVCSAQAGSPWNFEMSFDPTAGTTPYDQICTADSPTMLLGRIPVSGRGTHVQIRATHAAPGPATLSKMMIHYAASDTS